MVWIATSGTLTSTTTSVTFSGIPQTFTHLQIRAFGKSAFSGIGWLYIELNGLGTSNASYYSHTLNGDGTSASSFANPSVLPLGTMSVGSTPNIFGSAIVDILDYTNTNKNKTLRSITGYDANGQGNVALRSALLSSTNAITSMVLSDGGGGGWLAGSRFDLYGITSSQVTGA